MSDSRAATTEWIIYVSTLRTKVYTGIEAEGYAEAIEAFLAGEGELQPYRESNSEWKVDAVEAKR